MIRYRVAVATCGGVYLEQSDSFRELTLAEFIARKIMSDHAYDGAINAVRIIAEDLIYGKEDSGELDRQIVKEWKIGKRRQTYDVPETHGSFVETYNDRRDATRDPKEDVSVASNG